mmetsp:Transcript_39891/g.62230  ORF Transcript_39891/g.62230 Transcript_39891/m.62230 type:complete len:96 (+) Transcript_39891:1212-1499(+)
MPQPGLKMLNHSFQVRLRRGEMVNQQIVFRHTKPRVQLCAWVLKTYNSHSPSSAFLSVAPGPAFTSYLHSGSPALPNGKMIRFLSSRNDALPKAR